MIGVIFNTYALYKIFCYEQFDFKKNRFIIFLVFNLLSSVIVFAYIFSCGLLYCLPYILCAFWLSGVAYADYVSCNVYEIMEYYAVIPILLSILNIINNGTSYALPKLGAALVTVAAYGIMAKAGVFGEGDSDILSAVCIVYFDAYYNCIFFGLVMVLFVIRNFGYAVKNRVMHGNVRPLVPSIYMGYILMLPFVLGSTPEI